MNIEITPGSGVLFLSGYPVTIRMERGHLVAEDGIADKRRTIRIPRAQRELKRVVVHGHSGTVSFDALRWLQDVNAAFVHIDNDGTVLTTSAPVRVPDPRMLRGQVLAIEGTKGIEILRPLLKTKISRQFGLLDRLNAPDNIRELVENRLIQVELAESWEALRDAEAQAGKEYWRAWHGIQIQFRKSDKKRIPTHWNRLPKRKSALNPTNKNSTHPINTLLNYSYSILEAEARLAALGVGLDPHLGLMHSDYRWRPSLALDLMEPMRPMVDEFVLELLEERVFSYEDFFENRKGICRILPQLARELSEKGLDWRKSVWGIAEKAGSEFLKIGRNTFADESPPWRQRPHTGEYRITKTQAGERKRRGRRPV